MLRRPAHPDEVVLRQPQSHGRWSPRGVYQLKDRLTSPQLGQEIAATCTVSSLGCPGSPLSTVTATASPEQTGSESTATS